ncbi:MAG: hypothetical protein JST16_13725, partial [Bdellovibrionales bacterium]|nr:hypothetical protein [Bdellovibrionales bacterium]
NHDWIDTMDEHAELLQKLGVVPEAIASARQNWINKSWVHALKTTGAGGGDALLVWIEPEFERELSADIQSRGWWLSPHAIGAPAGSVHES